MNDAVEIYPLPRDGEESNRLNEQHYFITDIIDGLIAEDIPWANLSSFADIGTGTGIWIKEIFESMKHMPTDCPRYYHGFDISEAQFPSNPGEINFSVHDITKVPPPHYRHRFDMVHVRMLVGAIKESEFETVLANIMSLIKPGGYLQWVEFDIVTLLDGNGMEYPKFEELLQPYYNFATSNGLSLCASKALYRACTDAGMGGVARYCPTFMDRPGLEAKFHNWLLTSFSTIMPRIFLRTGTVTCEGAAKQLASRWLSDLEELLANGLKPGTTFGIVVAQKPLAI